MITFLRPTTRIYIGSYFEYPALICQVTIRDDMSPLYLVNWWTDSNLHEAWLNPCQFSLEQGGVPPDFEPIHLHEPDDDELPRP